MKLLTQKLRQALPPIMDKSVVVSEDPVVHCKFFSPGTGWRWYVIAGQPEGDDFRLYAYVTGFEDEFGELMLSDIEGVRDRWGLLPERDLYFTPGPLSKVVPMDHLPRYISQRDAHELGD